MQSLDTINHIDSSSIELYAIPDFKLWDSLQHFVARTSSAPSRLIISRCFSPDARRVPVAALCCSLIASCCSSLPLAAAPPVCDFYSPVPAR